VVSLRGRSGGLRRAWRPGLQLLLLLLLSPAAGLLPGWERAKFILIRLQHPVGVRHVYISTLCIGKKWTELMAILLIFLLLNKADSQRNFILYSQLLFVGIFFCHLSSQITYLTISKYIIAALQNLLLSTVPVKKNSFPTGPFIVFSIEAEIVLLTSGQYQNRCSIVSFGAGKFFFIIQNVHSGEVSALK
jgi:hypothetical protein